MASIADQMTHVYVFVDDYLKAHPAAAHWRLSNNAHPAFSDAEVITLALLQGCLGCASLKQTYRFVKNNLLDAFPHLCSYPQWLARLHALTPIVGQLVQVAGELAASTGAFYLLDSKPIPVCKPIRHGRVRLLREEGAYFGKNKYGWFFGFKLHVLVHHSGAILVSILTPGNWPDQEVALALAAAIEGGIGVADLAYRSEELAQLLAEEAQMVLLTPAVAAKGSVERVLISSVRQRVETTFSGLWGRFVDRVFSRSWEGLWNTIKLKMLHFNLCKAGLIPTA